MIKLPVERWSYLLECDENKRERERTAMRRRNLMMGTRFGAEVAAVARWLRRRKRG